MRRKKEDAEKTKDELLKAALKVFSEKGYASTRLEDIAREANVTRGAIYWHYTNKKNLYVAMIEKAYEKISIIIKNELYSDKSPIEKLESLLYTILIQIVSDEEFRKVEEISMFKAESEELKDIRDEEYEFTVYLKNSVMGIINEGIEQGEIKKDIDAEVGAISFLGFLSGVEILWLSHNDLFSLEKHAKSICNLFISGLRS